MTDSDVHITTLRVRTPDSGPAVRLRLTHLLNTADLLPVGLPPAAVLVVRRLADPLPGRLAPRHPAVRVDDAWERAVRRALDDLCRRAALPVGGAIPGEPDAVLFADAAEVLACRLLAKQRGQPPAWWWQGVQGDPAGPEQGTAHLLTRRPSLVPAALHYLDEWGAAVAVAASVRAAEALDVLRAVAKVYELPALALPPNRSSSLPIHTPPDPPSHARPGRPQPEKETPPWTAWLPIEASATLGREQTALLGVCLALQARPGAVRALAFGRALQRWWQAQEVIPRPSRPHPAPAKSTPAQEDGHEWHEEGTDTPLTPAVDEGATSPTDPAAPPPDPNLTSSVPQPVSKMPPPAGDDLTPTAGGEERAAQPRSVRDRRDRPARDPGSGSVASEQMPPPGAATAGRDVKNEVTDETSGQSERDLAPGSPEHAVVETGSAEAFSFPGEGGVATGVGGVLYLLNLMRVLNLPAACESGWGVASQVGAWGVLELLGRALLGLEGATHAVDPLWHALAELDGRAQETLPGAAYEMSGDRSLPAGWAAACDSWAPEDAPLLHDASEALLPWLALAVPFVRRRLQQALRLPDPGDVSDTLLVAGRLFVTPSHVDLVIDLNAISLPVRRAGLDANPGWLPACGRVVTFHFR